jgi:hypothetical protein
MIPITVNFVVWAENAEQAHYLASFISRGRLSTKEAGVYQSKIEFRQSEYDNSLFSIYDITLKTYIRWPKCLVQSQPEDITHILICNVSSSTCIAFDECKKYINQRLGIPFKFICSGEDLTPYLQKLDTEFIYEEEVISDQFLKIAVESCLYLDYMLRQVYDKLDINKNGQIRYTELLKISKSLSQTNKMTLEEAKEITFSLSKSGDISYPIFKKWWIMNKSEFQNFRRLVDVLISENSIIQYSNNMVNTYLIKMRTESELVSKTELDYEARIVISSVDGGKFYNKKNEDIIYLDYSSISLNGFVGMEIKSTLSSLPNYINIAPMNIILEFSIKVKEDGPYVIKALEDFKQLLFQFDVFKGIFDISGILLNFRQIDYTVCLDFSFSPELTKFLLGDIDSIEIDATGFVGSSKLLYLTALKPQELFDLTADLKDILWKFSNFKLECHGEFSHLKRFIDTVVDACSYIMGVGITDTLFNFMNLMKLLGNVKNLNIDLKYQQKDLQETIREVIGTLYFRKFSMKDHYNDKEKEIVIKQGFNKAQEEFKSAQKQLMAYFDKYKNSFKHYAYHIIESLKLIDYDKINVSLIFPGLSVFLKMLLIFPDFSKFLSDKFLRKIL